MLQVRLFLICPFLYRSHFHIGQFTVVESESTHQLLRRLVEVRIVHLLKSWQIAIAPILHFCILLLHGLLRQLPALGIGRRALDLDARIPLRPLLLPLLYLLFVYLNGICLYLQYFVQSFIVVLLSLLYRLIIFSRQSLKVLLNQVEAQVRRRLLVLYSFEHLLVFLLDPL